MPSLCLTDGACRHTFADTLQHPVYLTLASQTSVRSIKVGVLGDAWPGADREEFPLGVEVPGSITKWIVTAEGRLTIEWPDGTDNHFLGDLLAPELKFRVISNKDGGPVKRRGGGAHLAGAVGGAPTPIPAAKEKVIIPYKIGSLDFEQVWEVETDPITVDWRTEPRYKTALKIDPTHVTDMYYRVWDAVLDHRDGRHQILLPRLVRNEHLTLGVGGAMTVASLTILTMKPETPCTATGMLASFEPTFTADGSTTGGVNPPPDRASLRSLRHSSFLQKVVMDDFDTPLASLAIMARAASISDSLGGEGSMGAPQHPAPRR